MSGWDRIDGPMLQAVLDSVPQPWPRPVVELWLRHIDAAVADGRSWLAPALAPDYVRTAAAAADPIGRRALAEVTGLSTKVCRTLLETPEAWRDPVRATQGPAEGPRRARGGPDHARDLRARPHSTSTST